MSICILPWIHIEADAIGRAKPCCLYDERSPVGNFNTDSLDAIWHGPKIKDLRSEFLTGNKPKGCQQCWDTEDSGLKSKRLQDNERFQHLFDRIGNDILPPAYYDLKLGTICNIKCRICSSFSSFKWADDEKKLYGEVLNPNLQSFWVQDNSPVWKDLESVIEHMEYLDFTGGEPFLIKRHVQLLEKCVEQGYAKNISIHYNTNGTIKPTKKMLDIWKHFKWVEVMFSIDGIGDHFNYQRHPADWKVAEENFNFVKGHDYIHTSVCHTVNIFNVLYLDRFKKWFNKQSLPQDRLYLNMLHGPSHYNIKCLPLRAKEHVKKYLNDDGILEFMMSEQLDSIDDFIKYTNKLDQIRNESFKNTFPELSEIL